MSLKLKSSKESVKIYGNILKNNYHLEYHHKPISSAQASPIKIYN